MLNARASLSSQTRQEAIISNMEGKRTKPGGETRKICSTAGSKIKKCHCQTFCDVITYHHQQYFLSLCVCAHVCAYRGSCHINPQVWPKMFHSDRVSFSSLPRPRPPLLKYPPLSLRRRLPGRPNLLPLI